MRATPLGKKSKGPGRFHRQPGILVLGAAKIVTLLPSATEIVCALGFGERLVGRSHECDFPESVRSLPVCTAPNLDPGGTSPAIDGAVRSLLERALSIYRLDTDLLKRLGAEVVITQTQCDVCAVSLEEVEAALADWLEERPRLVSLAPRTLGDLWEDIARVAGALGAPERGTQLNTVLRARVASLQGRARELPERPTVACIEWIEPLMAAGNWVPELVELAGGRDRFGVAGEHAPWLQWPALAEADPEVIVLMPCGFDLEKTQSEMHWLTERPEWRGLRALREGRVYLTDGNQYFNRSGPRLVDSLEILAEILHPQQFNFGFEGTGWRKWDS